MAMSFLSGGVGLVGYGEIYRGTTSRVFSGADRRL
jgi:hypothetical protein